MKPTVFAGRFALLLVVTLFLAPVFANQSTNPTKWWTSEHYQRELSLSPEQIRRLEDIFQQALPKQKKLLTALDDAEAQFERLVDTAEEKVIVEQLERVVQARANLFRAHSLMLLNMRRVLKPEQWKRLLTLKDPQEKERQKNAERPR